MRIFIVGDYRTGTGPANVTKNYLKNLPEETLKLCYVNKVFRVLEILIKTTRADALVFSGYSKQNILGLKWARICRKSAFYLMHGCVEHENAINGVPDVLMSQVERQTMSLADGIFAVSEPFADWLKKSYKEFAHKISYVNNGVEWKILDKIQAQGEVVAERKNRIISIGGGMPRKMIAHICEAIATIREKTGCPIALTVIGEKGLDSDRINAYKFVDNLGIVPYEKTIELLKSSELFIQNSCFETFGLAPLEALSCGCNILLSKNVGAISLFDEVNENDLIRNCDDSSEIAEKILKVLEHGNYERLIKAIDKESTSWEARTRQLVEAIKKGTKKR